MGVTHPAIVEIMDHFDYNHLPPHLRTVSRELAEVAEAMVEYHELTGPEVTVGLRKLLEAKDCFVRAAVQKAKVAA